MINEIVVGYDGTESSDDALSLASRLASACSSRLLVAFAHDNLVARASDEAALVVAAHVEAVFARAREQLDPQLRAEYVDMPSTSPARALHALAETKGADLLVVGSRRLGAFGRITGGASVSQPVLHAAPCAIAIPPRGFRDCPLRRIAVGWVSTTEADAALSLAAGLARASGAHLTLLTAINAGSSMAGFGTMAYYPEHFFEELARDARETAEQAVVDLTGDVPTEIDVVIGDAAEELIERSEQLDLIVLGSRDYGPIKRVLLGGVTTRVVREARCPVIVLPRSAAPETAQAATSTAAVGAV